MCYEEYVFTYVCSNIVVIHNLIAPNFLLPVINYLAINNYLIKCSYWEKFTRKEYSNIKNNYLTHMQKTQLAY